MCVERGERPHLLVAVFSAHVEHEVKRSKLLEVSAAHEGHLGPLVESAQQEDAERLVRLECARVSADGAHWRRERGVRVGRG